jgi:hypothetical protein
MFRMRKFSIADYKLISIIFVPLVISFIIVLGTSFYLNLKVNEYKREIARLNSVLVLNSLESDIEMDFDGKFKPETSEVEKPSEKTRNDPVKKLSKGKKKQVDTKLESVAEIKIEERGVYDDRSFRRMALRAGVSPHSLRQAIAGKVKPQTPKVKRIVESWSVEK